MLHLMNNRVNIKRRTPTQTGLVVNPGTPATVASNVACLIQEDSGQVRPYPTGDRLTYKAIAFMPVGTDIQPMKGSNQTDTLVIVSHPTIPAGSEFLVLHVHNPGGVQSLAAQHLEVYLGTP